MARSRDTMNRPDSSVLNIGAEPTVAAKAFEKAVKENSVTPAIATGFVPPVVKKDEEKRAEAPSPFRQIKNQDGEEKPAEAKKPAGPAIASGFIPMPGYMKKQEINPFKSNKGPVKRPVSASVNRAAAEASGEIAEEVVEEEQERSSERPSFTAALAGREVHSTFRPTEFKLQTSVDPFRHEKAAEPKNVKAPDPEPERVIEKKPAPTSRRSPFRSGPSAAVAAEPEPEIEKPVPVPAEPEIDPVPVQTPEAEAPDKEKEPEIAAEPADVSEPVQAPKADIPSVQNEEPEPELVFPSYTDEDIDNVPLGDTSPFKPLDHKVDPDEAPSPQRQKTEPTYYTSGSEEKSRGGILGGLFKRR